MSLWKVNGTVLKLTDIGKKILKFGTKIMKKQITESIKTKIKANGACYFILKSHYQEL